MDSKPPGSDPREVLGQCRPSPGPLAGRDTAGRPLLLKSWMQPRWEAEVPRGALAIRPDPPWGALGPARGPAALPLRRACSMSPTRRAWFPRRRRRRRRPGPARSPPAPRPLPARLPALLLALDRGGRTASQNAPPESGAQGPGGVVCVCWEFFCKDPDLRGKGVSSGASGDGWKVGVQGSCPHGKKGMRKRKPRLTGGGQDSLSGGPPPRCRYRLKTCPCTSSRQDGSFWTSVKGSSLQESVAGELPPFGVTGPRNNTVILLAPITTYLGLRVPTWPPCIQSPCIQSPWRCPCCCSTS
ncbi:translation initiation factor IF-2-like isoform X5 [Prionailurus viverrinus]|uniref:translation initiation factor IF-2-like isoform X5 n=2 Tax=Prionailurus viverrinus TaxID=61388 RepID=UPI001FF4E387|nr:translation initiation factor IF-2-like isoform X5 [Prionailurus viverrinus]